MIRQGSDKNGLQDSDLGSLWDALVSKLESTLTTQSLTISRWTEVLSLRKIVMAANKLINMVIIVTEMLANR